MNKNMTFILILMLVTGFIFGFAPIKAEAEEVAEPASRQLAVEGNASIRLDPDIAKVSLAVQSEKETAMEAADECAEKMAQIFKVLDENGIAKEDYHTASFEIQSQTNWQTSPPEVYGYQVTNRIEITFRDVNQVSPVLTAVLDAGANSVDQISYDLEDHNTAYDQALEKAVMNAQEKAHLLAEEANLTLADKPISVTEIGSPQIYNPIFNMRNDLAMNITHEAEIPLTPNQVEVSAYVKVIYATGETPVEASQIVVNGRSLKQEKADFAQINLGFVAQAETAKEAANNNLDTMIKIYRVLDTFGIETKDYHTRNFYVSPLTDWESNPPAVYAYEVNNELQVIVRDLDRLGDIVGQALDEGANRLNNIQFCLEDQDVIYNQALKEAAARAKAKAQIIASCLKLTPAESPLLLTENDAGSYAFMNSSPYNINSGYLLAPREEAKADMVGGMGAAGYMPFASDSVDVAAYAEAIYEAK